MTSFSRNKGKRGELAVCRIIFELTGWEAKRRVRNDAGDSDLIGIPGWSVEVKDHSKAMLGDVREWWAQACRQADGIPLLVYKRQRGEWRAVYPLSIHLCMQEADWWKDCAYTVETSLEAWAAVAREMCGND